MTGHWKERRKFFDNTEKAETEMACWMISIALKRPRVNSGAKLFSISSLLAVYYQRRPAEQERNEIHEK